MEILQCEETCVCEDPPERAQWSHLKHHLVIQTRSVPEAKQVGKYTVPTCQTMRAE